GSCVREKQLLTLPQYIFKMTGGSAAALGLTDRGVLRDGAWADITVFDPETIADTATYDAPHQYAVGVSTVVVNGTVVIDGGEHTGALPGRVLRFNQRTRCPREEPPRSFGLDDRCAAARWPAWPADGVARRYDGPRSRRTTAPRQIDRPAD